MSHTLKLRAVVLAGGAGTRFWPLSRRKHPKQLLNLTAKEPMIACTFTRVESIIPPERWWMVVGASMREASSTAVPGVASHHVLGEPCGRNTAPAIGLAAIHLAREDPDAIMAVLPADHHVSQPAEFCAALEMATEIAAGGALVTLGIRPEGPETGYGYIQRGESLPGAPGAFEVRRFCEKPTVSVARTFLEEGSYDWNAGVFVMRCDRYLSALEEHLPDIYGGLSEVSNAIGTPDYDRVLKDAYLKMEGISIDYGVMEKARQVAVVPVNCGWSDVGTYGALNKIIEADEQGNVVRGRVAAIDTSNCTFYATDDHVVATVGLEGLVVVHTPDVTLVIPADRVQDVRSLVAKIEEKKWDEYL